MTEKQYGLAVAALERAGLIWQRTGATSAQGRRLHVPVLARTYCSYQELMADLRRISGGEEEREALLQRLVRRGGPPRPGPADGYTMTEM